MKKFTQRIGAVLLAAAVFLLALVVLAVVPATKVADFRQAHTVASFALVDGLRALRHTFVAWLTNYAMRTGGTLAAFPASVRLDIGYGVVGELQFEGPLRATAWTIDPAATAANCVVGRVFTIAQTGLITPGGAGVFGGILANPKEYASLGTAAGGPLAPTLLLPPGSVGTLVDMGEILVQVVNAVTIGGAAYVVTADGTIGCGAPGGGQTAIPNAKFVRVANAAAGIAVLRLTN